MDFFKKKKFVDFLKTTYNFLIELGYNDKKNSDDYIIYPERVAKSTTIMNDISKGFTHYRKGTGITKNISLKTLRKTYITWVNQAMGTDTGLITSHSTEEVIEKYYIDPKILSAIEIGAMNIKVFGEIPHAVSSC